MAQDLKDLSRGGQRDVLIELVRQGKSDEEIGQAFDMSQWQVRNLRYRLGLKKDRGGNLYVEPPLGSRSSEDSTESSSSTPFGQDRDGLALCIRGQYQAADLSRRLEALRALIMSDAADKRYELSLELVELMSETNDAELEVAQSGAADN